MAFHLQTRTPRRHARRPADDRGAVPNWQVGNQIPQGPDKPALLVIGIRAASDPNTTRCSSWKRPSEETKGEGPVNGGEASGCTSRWLCAWHCGQRQPPFGVDRRDARTVVGRSAGFSDS